MTNYEKQPCTITMRCIDTLPYFSLRCNGDFADIRGLTGKDHHGVIRLRIENQRIGYAHPLPKEALEKLRDMNLHNTLVTVMDDRLRIRKTS